MENKNDFEYTYTVPTSEERREIESIRNSYMQKPASTNKLQLLRKLDNRVKNVPQTVSIIIGILGGLIFGLGMAMILEWGLLAWGIVVSVVGAIVMVATYFIHLQIVKILKNKYSKEILRLSEELLNDENK